MTMTRWQQRLINYEKALLQLAEAVTLSSKRALSNLEKQGLIQAFEFTHELAWNVMKDYFINQGNTRITGSRDAVREAFAQGLIDDGETWMEMITSRNKTSHTYNLSVADDIAEKIINQYTRLFTYFLHHMQALSHEH